MSKRNALEERSTSYNVTLYVIVIVCEYLVKGVAFGLGWGLIDSLLRS